MGALILEGFFLGLSTGPYCLTACAPLFFPYMLADGSEGWKAQGLLFVELLAGRLAAYLLVGLLAGAAGAAFAGRLSSRVLGAGLLASGLLLLAVCALKTWPQASLCSRVLRARATRRAPFLLGFLVGVNLCPPFAAGLVRVLGLGGAGLGAAYFLAFFAGTSLYLLPLLCVAPFTGNRRLQDIGAILCGLMGLWFCAMGLKSAVGP